jgi:translation initiation factor RLI1
MTEDEAKQKWCPMVRMDKETFGNRFEDGDNVLHNSNCIGSACMMWRENFEPVGVMDERGLACIEMKNAGGFCGLAGKP